MSSFNLDDFVGKDLSSTIVLNDGNRMPLFGLGVYKADTGIDNEAEKATVFALQNGYRLVDTAQFYNNESDIGRAIKLSGIPRKDIFVVTKLMHHGYDVCKSSFMDSLKKLDLEYVDLFLIHTPRGGKNIESYDAMIELQKQGLIKQVSFQEPKVETTYHYISDYASAKLKEAGRPTPAVNQIELHPYWQQQRIVDYCRQNGIAVMGFTPLTRGTKLQDPNLIAIAKKYNKVPAQVLLRWSVQNGYITIPKSVTPERILQNADVYDFSISKEDMEEMKKFPQEKCTIVSTDLPWEG